MELGNGSLHESNISSHYADLIFKFNGCSLLMEYAHRNADNPSILDVNNSIIGQISTGEAFNAAAGLFISEKNEIAARYTYVNELKENANVISQYTLGLNRFLAGHSFKVQADLNYTISNSDGSYWEFRSGFELHF